MILIFLLDNLVFVQYINDFIDNGLDEKDIGRELSPLESLKEKLNLLRLKFFDTGYDNCDGILKLEKSANLVNCKSAIL